MNLDSLLIEAVKSGLLPVIKQLVEAGANVIADNNSALRWAAYNDHLEIVKYLVSVGADVRVCDYIALLWGACDYNTEVANYLNSEIEKMAILSN